MSAAPERVPGRQGVVIAVDPHKASWTAVVVTADLAAADSIRVEVNRAGYRRLRRFAAAWPDARWAIEGAAGLGAPLTERLRDQIAVLDVPAKLARRVRLLSTGHGRKSDKADTLSIGIAAWSAPALRTVQIDEAIAALRAVTEHRDDMVRTRTQLINPAARAAGQTRPLRTAPRADRRGSLRRASPHQAARSVGPNLAHHRRRTGRPAAPPGPPHRRRRPHPERRRHSLTDHPHQAARYRRRRGRQDCGPHRTDQQVPDLGRLRLLLRRRTDRSLLRRRRAPPVIPSRRPATELRPPTSWRYPRSHTNHPAAPTTSANAAPGKATKKRCDA
jgi:hypothetical protein